MSILDTASDRCWQDFTINKLARSAVKSQPPLCIWLTGLSGSGKTTIANLLDKRLYTEGYHTYVLDGDNLRHGLNSDLSFSDADRTENIRRVAETASLMVDAGLIVIVSLISPFRANRAFARNLFRPNEFYEVFIDAPIEECMRRDPKGLYAKSRKGRIHNLTGVDSPYDVPSAPEIHLKTIQDSPETCVEIIIQTLSLPFREKY